MPWRKSSQSGSNAEDSLGIRALTAKAAFGLGGPEAHGRKGAFNGIGGANVLPVLGREVVDGEQHVAVLGQAGHRQIIQHFSDLTAVS